VFSKHREYFDKLQIPTLCIEGITVNGGAISSFRHRPAREIEIENRDCSALVTVCTAVAALVACCKAIVPGR